MHYTIKPKIVSSSLSTVTRLRILHIKRTVLKVLRQNGGVYQDETVKHRVVAVGRRIALAAGFNDESLDFLVLNNPDLQAMFHYPGFIYITYGYCKLFQRDDELAAVLGHEIGHHVLLNERAKSRPSTQRLKKFVTNKFLKGRRDEYAADALSFEFLDKAGYDSTAVLTALRWSVSRGLLFDEQNDCIYDIRDPRRVKRYRLNAIEVAEDSTHPLIFDRINNVKKLLEQRVACRVIPKPPPPFLGP